MRITLWQQFSSNHSSSFTVVGEFATHADAEAAVIKIRQILANLGDWQEQHEEEMDAWWDKGDLAGYPLELAQQYNIEWHGAIDWFRKARVDIVLDRLVYITPGQRPEADGQPFDQLVNRLGGKGYHEGDIYSDDTGWILFNLTCQAPDEDTATAIYKRNLGFNRRIKHAGTQLQFYKWRFDEHPNLTTLIKNLEAEGCTGIQFDFQQVIPADDVQLHGADDLEVLIDVLNNVTDSEDRKRAAEVLGDIGDPRAVEPLIKALSSDDHDVQRSIVMSLGDLKDRRAVEPLLVLLKDTSSELTWVVIEALGKIADPRVIQPLIASLSDEDYSEEIVDILGLIGAPALEPLQQALANANSQERDRIETALQLISDTVQGGKLLADMRNENEKIAQNAFEQVLASGGVDTMLAFLRNPGSNWRSKLPNQVIDTLVELKEERLVPILINRLSYYGHNVISALTKLGTPSVEALIQLEKTHRNSWMRESILQALIRIGDSRAFDVLVQALNTSADRQSQIFLPVFGSGDYKISTQLFQDIIRFLGQLGDKRAIEPLQNLMSSVHKEMQKVIEEALQKIDAKNAP